MDIEEERSLTEEEMELFSTEVDHWVNVLGMRGWQIVLELRPQEDMKNEDTLAEVVIPSYSQQMAIMSVSNSWPFQDITPEYIKRVAFHEILEIFYAQLGSLNNSRFGVTREDWRQEIHRHIRTWENVFYGRV